MWFNVHNADEINRGFLNTAAGYYGSLEITICQKANAHELFVLIASRACSIFAHISGFTSFSGIELASTMSSVSAKVSVHDFSILQIESNRAVDLRQRE